MRPDILAATLRRTRGSSAPRGAVAFLVRLDNSVVADFALDSRVPTFTRNSAQYGRTLTGLASHAIDVPAIETFADAAGNTVRGYLSEEARTRLIAHPSDLENWTARGTATVTPNAAVAPDGTTTADLLEGIGLITPTLNDIYDYYSGATPSAAYEPSFWIKRVSTSGTLRVSNPYDYNGRWDVDLSLLGSGWERITRTHPAVTVAEGYPDFANSIAPGYGGIDLYAQAGAPLSFYIWGAQCEEAAFASSTIAGDGAAVRAPTLLRYAGGRNVCDGSGPRTYIARFVCEPGRSGYLWSISDGGSAADRIYATIEPSTGRARIRTAISAGNTGDVTGTSDLADGEEHEVIVQLATNSLRLIVDGTAEGTPDTSVAIPQNLDRWDVGADESGASHLNGNVTYLQCSVGLVLA